MKHNPLINETLLQMKYARIISLLAERLDITADQALELFYHSTTYSHLDQLQHNLHNMSDHYLADEILAELQVQQ